MVKHIGEGVILTNGACILMDSGTVAGLREPGQNGEAATKLYVDTKVAANNAFVELVDGPMTYAGASNKFVVVAGAENGVCFKQVLNLADRVIKGTDTTDDVIVDSTSKGMVLKDSGNNYWRISVNTDGTLSTTSLGATKP